jgi:hypothetical protein
MILSVQNGTGKTVSSVWRIVTTINRSCEEHLGLHLLPIVTAAICILSLDLIGFGLFPNSDDRNLRFDEKENKTILQLNGQLKESERIKFVLNNTAAHLVWSASAGAQLFAIVVAIGLFLKSIVYPRRLSVDVAREPVLRAVARAALSITPALLTFLLITSSQLRQSSGNDGVRLMPAPFEVPVGILKAAQQKQADLQCVGTFTSYCNGLAVALIILAVFACSTAVARTWTVDQSQDRFAELIKVQLTKIQNLLSVCSAVMIVAVIQINLQYRWLAAVLVESAQKPVIAIADSSSIAAGTVFAIVMVSLFGSGAYVLWRRIDCEVPANVLTFSLRDFYSQIGKVLAPAIVAGLSAVLNMKVSG